MSDVIQTVLRRFVARNSIWKVKFVGRRYEKLDNGLAKSVLADMWIIVPKVSTPFFQETAIKKDIKKTEEKIINWCLHIV